MVEDPLDVRRDTSSLGDPLATLRMKSVPLQVLEVSGQIRRGWVRQNTTVLVSCLLG